MWYSALWQKLCHWRVCTPCTTAHVLRLYYPYLRYTERARRTSYTSTDALSTPCIIFPCQSLYASVLAAAHPASHVFLLRLQEAGREVRHRSSLYRRGSGNSRAAREHEVRRRRRAGECREQPCWSTNRNSKQKKALFVRCGFKYPLPRGIVSSYKSCGK